MQRRRRGLEGVRPRRAVLLAERDLARHREEHASEPRGAPVHARRLAFACDRRPVLGKLPDSRADRLVLRQPAGGIQSDCAACVAKDAWTAQCYGSNISNTRADLFSSYSQFVKAETINVPRTFGLKLSYNFG